MFGSYSYSTTYTHFELLSSMDEMKSLLMDGLRRKHSTLSLHSVASSFAPSVRTKEAMKQLCKHLYKAGVTADMIRNREAHAVAVFQYPNVPPVASQEISQTPGPVVHGDELLAERQIRKSGIRTSRINSTPVRGTALHVAAAIGFRQGVQLLLANGANIEAMRGDNESTPLDTAVWNGHTDVVRLLLEKGANIEAIRTTGSGATPLDSAACRGHTDVVRLLLEKGANRGYEN